MGIYMEDFFKQLNIGAVLTSGVVFWFLGFVWYSLLFGKAWAKGLEKHGIVIKEPSRGSMIFKMIMTYVFTTLVAFGVAIFVYMLDIEDVSEAVCMGLALGIFFSACTAAKTFLWEGRPFIVSLIDISYSVIGILFIAMIITAWQ